MSATIKRKPALMPEWEKRLATLLKDEGIICSAFTGKLELNIYMGGVAGCKREDVLK